MELLEDPHEAWYYEILILYIKALSPSVCLWPLDAKKNDNGRREKWREKDKMTVGWRAFEVLKPRSWEPGPETSRRGLETQVLKARSWNLALRAWNPGPEIQVLKPRIEVLKPRSWNLALRSWNPGPESQISRSWNPGLETSHWGPETQVLRAKYRGPETQVLRACVHY